MDNINRQLSYVPVDHSIRKRAEFISRVTGRTLQNELNNRNEIEEAHGLAEHLINISPFNKRWKVTETINQGAYGVVFAVEDILTKFIFLTPGVIKVAKSIVGGNKTAEWEGFILERIFRQAPNSSVVRILDKGLLADQFNIGMEFMVLEKAQIDVKKYINETSKYLRKQRVCYVALHSLKAIYDLHSQGFLHRDLKPDNMGIYSVDQPLVLLFDLGMARMYTDYYNTIRPPRTVVHFRGTPEWASGHALKSRDQNRFDDLIAWLYVIVELFDSMAEKPLPWSYLRNTKAIRYLKSTYCPARLLLHRCPTPFYAINSYLMSANPLGTPNYRFLADCVSEAIEECQT